MPWIVLIASHLIRLTGPDNQIIEVNPAEIVSVRQPRVSDHFASGSRCAINTTDGKIVVVQELCTSVMRFIEYEQDKP